MSREGCPRPCDEFRYKKQSKAAIAIQAARETVALKEAKDKLQKRVEERTWRLQQGKRLRTEMEETKTQEIIKLQEALHASEIQMEEAKSKAIQEQEAARKAFEESLPVIKETLVIVQDTEKIGSLAAEVESLKL
ncbi:hypothetical protein OROMI_004096 [Orobanche minor]